MHWGFVFGSQTGLPPPSELLIVASAARGKRARNPLLLRDEVVKTSGGMDEATAASGAEADSAGATAAKGTESVGPAATASPATGWRSASEASIPAGVLIWASVPRTIGLPLDAFRTGLPIASL